MNKDSRVPTTLYVSSDKNASAVRARRRLPSLQTMDPYHDRPHRFLSPVQGRRAEHRLQCVFTQSPDEPASGRSSAVPSTVPSAVPSVLTFG